MEHRPLISLDVTGLARLRHDLLDQGDSISRLVWRRQADIWNRQGFSVDCIESAVMEQKEKKNHNKLWSLANETRVVFGTWEAYPGCAAQLTVNFLPAPSLPSPQARTATFLQAKKAGQFNNEPIDNDQEVYILHPQDLDCEISVSPQLTLPSTTRPQPRARPRPGTSRPGRRARPPAS